MLLQIALERLCSSRVNVREYQAKGMVAEPVPKPNPSEAPPLMRKMRAGPIVSAGCRRHVA